MRADRRRRALATCAVLALVASPAGADDVFPDEALLEFLADWEDGDGDWIDPLELAEYEIDEDGHRTEMDGDDDN